MANYTKPRKPVNRQLEPLELRFVTRFIEHMDFAKACKEAQIAPRTGKRYMQDPAIRAIIEDKVGVVLEEAKINASRVAQEVASMAFSNIAEVIEIGEGGETISLRDISLLPPTVQAAIKEVSVVPNKFGNTIKVTMHEKMPAVKMLAEITKLGKKDSDKSSKKDYRNASSDELKRLITKMTGTDDNIVNFQGVRDNMDEGSGDTD